MPSPTDTKAELDLVERKCNELGVNVALSEVWAKGGEGGKALAEEVIRLCEQPSHFQFVYDTQASIQEKLDTIVKKVYHGERVVLTANAKKQAQQLTDLGFGDLPICMAKTQYSFSDDQTLLGAPSGFEVTVRNLKDLRRRRLHRGPHRRYHDHARPAQSPLCREDRRRRERQDHRPVLSRAWAFGCGSTRRSCGVNPKHSGGFPAGRIYFARGSKKQGPHRIKIRWGAMPGLPKVPSAEKIDVDENGRITGLF